MRHFSARSASDMPSLPRRVRVLPVRRRLVPRPGLLQRLSPGSAAASRAAVPVTAIMASAQEEHLAAIRPAARHEPKRLPHGTRCTPPSGDAPRTGLRLAPSRARQGTRARRARWASQCPLRGPSSSWASLSTLMRSSPQPANRFSVSSPDPTSNQVGHGARLELDAVRLMTTTTMVISAAINSTSIHFHADLADHSQPGRLASPTASWVTPPRADSTQSASQRAVSCRCRPRVAGR